MSLQRRETCALCGKTKNQVPKLIVGAVGGVCPDCISLCNDILSRSASELSTGPATPEEELLRDDVLRVNQLLPKLGLVTMHSGNASGYSPEADLMHIKPSGMDYDRMEVADLVPVRVSTGEVLHPNRKPSVDLPHHLFLYRNLPGLRGIVHTHSNFATAFAAAHKAIPLVLTAIADEFGGDIPCAPFASNEGDAIGRSIVEHCGRAPAILLANHGVFAWGDSPNSALKAAVMVEDVAKTVMLSQLIGDPVPIPKEEAEKWFDRYQHRYGQVDKSG